MDRDFVEREYNNRGLVPEHPQYFARWERDSQYVRSTLQGHLDLAYGPHERQRLDIFPSAGGRGTLVFIHGGYWRSLDKDLFSWLAAPYVAAGIGVALPRYRLVPGVRIEDVVEDAIDAVNWLFANGARHGLSMERVVLSGWSAGAHLAAAVFAAPRERLAFEPARVAGGVALSGVFDFEPLRHFSFNEEFRLDPAAVARLDLAPRRPTIAAPLVVAAGAAESSEFRRQSKVLADAWRPQARPLMLLPGVHHFGTVDAFAERGQPLHQATLGLF
ncbi:MAG TPA: alpha/beta hydrolase [Usitatibacter sp.]|nr:alpha/beta hydrolase [Usitatibacter sp.]